MGGLTTASSANNSNLSVVGNSAFVNYSLLNVTQNYILYEYDTTLTTGDTLCFTIKMDKIGNETDTTDNETTLCIPAVNSYDPNDKQVSIASMDASGDFTDRTDHFTYTVRFQNTGTAAARNIYILDDIDPKLDLSTLNILTSSHDMKVALDDSRQIRFDFKDINLPDSASNPEGSMGHLVYSIKPMPDLDTGESISNFASIYFDFNEPIITNTTVNTFVRKSSTDNSENNSIEEVNEDFNIYPIPSSTLLYINTKAKFSRYSIYNMLGEPVKTMPYTKVIDIKGLSEGVYFLHLEKEDRYILKKFIKH